MLYSIFSGLKKRSDEIQSEYQSKKTTGKDLVNSPQLQYSTIVI
jgi:hypothetical protein